MPQTLVGTLTPTAPSSPGALCLIDRCCEHGKRERGGKPEAPGMGSAEACHSILAAAAMPCRHILSGVPVQPKLTGWMRCTFFPCLSLPA